MRFSTLAALAAAGTMHAQQPVAPSPSARSQFAVTAAGDTIAIERITRDAARVESDLLVKAQGARITFSMSLAPDATVPKLVTEARPADAPTSSAPIQRAALAYLRTRPDIDHDDLGLIGHSEGALIALMIGASDPKLRTVVLIAGSSRTGRQISDAQVRAAFENGMHLSGAALDSAIRANEPARDAQLAHPPGSASGSTTIPSPRRSS